MLVPCLLELHPRALDPKMQLHICGSNPGASDTARNI